MKIIKPTILFLIGGSVYFLIEVIYKTLISGSIIHWSMFLLGGLCFLIIGALNECIPWEMSIIKQSLIGATIITALEFIFGCVLNLWLNLNIWNYTNLPFNILGQVCLPFYFIWIILSLVAIVIDDILRWKLFKEEKPHYHLKDAYNCNK